MSLMSSYGGLGHDDLAALRLPASATCKRTLSRLPDFLPWLSLCFLREWLCFFFEFFRFGLGLLLLLFLVRDLFFFRF